MIENYIKIALRVLLKNRLYAAINISGLALGLAIFLISQVLADYEYNYDNFFEHSDNIYVPYIELTPGGPLGDGTMPTMPTAARVVLEILQELKRLVGL